MLTDGDLQALNHEAEERKRAALRAAEEQYRRDVEAIERVRTLLSAAKLDGAGEQATEVAAATPMPRARSKPTAGSARRRGTMTDELFKIAELLRQPFTAPEVYEKYIEIHPNAASTTTAHSVSATLSRRIGSDYEQVEKGQGGKPSYYKVIKAEEVPSEDSDESPVGSPTSPET